MKVAVVGTGYVGLVAGVCFADAGHDVVCVDRDEKKIARLLEGEIPIYEPGLKDLLATAKSRMEFSTDLSHGVKRCDVIFVAVGTPEKEDGSADMSFTYDVIEGICKHANNRKFVVLKSTVPIGTAKDIQKRCDKICKYEIEVVNNPEFLREGSAIEDFLHPDRVVIGCRTEEAIHVMRAIYEPFVKSSAQIMFMDNVSAEMTKYAANAFLSVKISYINELALLADKVGADINQVRRGFTSDSRINPAFFYPGVGFGGSCFPKDIKALIYSGEKFGVPMRVVRSADEANDVQKLVMFEKLKNHYGKDLKGLKVALWGLAFKPRTDDVREAPAKYLIQALHGAGVKVVAYDPIAAENARRYFDAPFEVVPKAMDAVHQADALILVTEWNEFRSTDLKELKQKMRKPVIFDGRNVFNPTEVVRNGFHYYCVGREGVPHIEQFKSLNEPEKKVA